MEKIRCVIIEDEIPAIEELKYLLELHDFIEVIGISQNGLEGLKLVKNLCPDVIFMDINMPGLNGIELAKRVREFNDKIKIIFVTAYEEHALRAFEVAATDYLLKPFDEKRIDKTINRIKSMFIEVEAVDNDLSNRLSEIIRKIDKEDKFLKRIPCEINGKIILVDISSIFYCFIEDEKTYVKTFDKKLMTHHTLGEIEDKTNFFRCHRSYLVNIENITELHPWFHSTYKLIMKDKEKSELPLSRNNVKKLKEILGL